MAVPQPPANSTTRRRAPGITAVAGELHLSTAWKGHWLTVAVHGSINADTAATFRAHLRSGLAESPLTAVNLAEADLADASGIAVLVGVHRRAQQAGKVFLIVEPTPPTTQVLHRTGLDRHLLICPSWDDLLGPNSDSHVPPGTSVHPNLAQQVAGTDRGHTWFA